MSKIKTDSFLEALKLIKCKDYSVYLLSGLLDEEKSYILKKAIYQCKKALGDYEILYFTLLKEEDYEALLRDLQQISLISSRKYIQVDIIDKPNIEILKKIIDNTSKEVQASFFFKNANLKLDFENLISNKDKEILQVFLKKYKVISEERQFITLYLKKNNILATDAAIQYLAEQAFVDPLGVQNALNIVSLFNDKTLELEIVKDYIYFNRKIVPGEIISLLLDNKLHQAIELLDQLIAEEPESIQFIIYKLIEAVKATLVRLMGLNPTTRTIFPPINNYDNLYKLQRAGPVKLYNLLNQLIDLELTLKGFAIGDWYNKLVLLFNKIANF